MKSENYYMKLAIVNSNQVKIFKNTKKGTEIFDYLYIKHLAKIAHRKKIEITAFASGNSILPVPTESINYYASTEDKYIGSQNYQVFEIALIAKAFSMQEKFDLFHVSIGLGEFSLPFARFVKKPILFTLHNSLDQPFVKKFISLYKDFPNVYFAPISNYQKKPCPNLNYVKTIYHGIDTVKGFHFNAVGGKEIIWTGRAIPDKGLDIVLSVVKRVKKKAKVFPMIKEDYLHWLHEEIIKKRNLIYQTIKIFIDFDVNRSELNHQYQTSKLFLFPLQWEEPFGLTLIESMACGTPVVAYARGSVPEIVKDGETGFIVNQSNKDKRGDWVIKKTGIDGLCEAVERIYSMPEEKYKIMRKACREHVEKHFTVERMVNDYIQVYEEILSKKH